MKAKFRLSLYLNLWCWRNKFYVFMSNKEKIRKIDNKHKKKGT